MSVTRITFPYERSVSRDDGKRLVIIFFGKPLHLLPEGTNRQEFIERTNRMLAYIQRQLPGLQYVYLPHPSETAEECESLELGAFTVHKHTIAELYMWKHIDEIAWTFSSCSWASGTAYAMGFKSAIFLDTLYGSIPDDAVEGWRSYFNGFQKDFFIPSFDEPLPDVVPKKSDDSAIQKLGAMFKDVKCVWFLAAGPALGLQAAMLAHQLRARHPDITCNLIKVNHGRWSMVDGGSLFSKFDKIFSVPYVWYSARPRGLWHYIKLLVKSAQVPVAKEDAVISFNHAIPAENAVFSYRKPRVRVLFVESRWFHFTYEDGWKKLPRENFRRLPGHLLYQYVLQPLVGLYSTVFLQYRDGKVLDYYRYKAPLEQVYDAVFVVVPPGEKT